METLPRIVVIAKTVRWAEVWAAQNIHTNKRPDLVGYDGELEFNALRGMRQGVIILVSCPLNLHAYLKSLHGLRNIIIQTA
jgi:hypothetical protein